MPTVRAPHSSIPLLTASHLADPQFEITKEYKLKFRSLFFNLKDDRNQELRQRVLLGEVLPGRLVRTTQQHSRSRACDDFGLVQHSPPSAASLRLSAMLFTTLTTQSNMQSLQCNCSHSSPCSPHSDHRVSHHTWDRRWS
jgi:hypothetical protein